jgi:hypothetical protein
MIREPFFLAIVAQYLLLTACFGVGLCLFVRLRKQVARLGAECSDNASSLAAALRTTEAEQADLRRDLERVVSRTEASGTVRPVAGNFPRDRIVRLHEQGESPAAIAQTLGLPDGQVKLLLKVRGLFGTQNTELRTQN